MLHVKEEESSTAIHPSAPLNTPLTRSERGERGVPWLRGIKKKKIARGEKKQVCYITTY